MDSLKFVSAAAEAAPKMEDEEGLMWRPSKSDTEGHQLEIIRRAISEEEGVDLKDYKDLHAYSVANPDKFWHFLWKHMGIKCSKQPDLPVLDTSVPMDQIPEWFKGARMNYAENLLRHPDDEHIAYYYTSERIQEIGLKSKTFGQLRRRVAFIARALRAHGVAKGDRIAGYIPNCPEAIEIMAAVASVGAVWSCTSPDFGVSGVLDRFRQIEPKIIFSVEAVSYNLKKHDHLAKLRAVVEGLPKLERVVVIPYLTGDKADIDLGSTLPAECNATFFPDFIGEESGSVPEMAFEQVPFSHPLFIMYSSGTTGAPKCMVHSVGGTLMKHLEEHQIQGNRGASDVLLYYTTTGWMMWNWMVSALALGTTLVLYDGSPLLPHPAAMWDLVDKCGITVFGTSAKWIDVQESRGVKPAKTHDLSTLKAICSTGSPLSPHSYDYVYRDIKSNVLLASISGGTDIIACFMGENSVLPVYRGEIQSPHLGCDIQCWDEDGNAVEPGTESGELVCATPFPSMPVRFWNDTDGDKYRKAYFAKFPERHIWAHGDFIYVSKSTGGYVMLGRSDGTLNPNGVRFGSAEIYSILETIPEVTDSVCVGQRSPVTHEERVILFLKTEGGKAIEESLVTTIKAKIRQQLSARHVPALILPISDIPYTVNGKKVEVAVKKMLVGETVKNQSALANPECLELYKDIPETHKW